MSVRPETLENPERDLNLVNRQEDERSAKRKRDEAAGFRERIETARQLKPEGSDLHCVDCFQRGRDAAIRLIEGAKGT
jgi:hypothetical protein